MTPIVRERMATITLCSGATCNNNAGVAAIGETAIAIGFANSGANGAQLWMCADKASAWHSEFA